MRRRVSMSSLALAVLGLFVVTVLIGTAEAGETKQFFSQKLNHFDNLDPRRFQQKFYVLDDYYVEQSPPSPIFLYINGESPCSGAPGNWVREYAKEFGSLLITLEHRFYGESQPFNQTTTDNLKYLSSKQAIEDTANFVRTFNAGTVPNSGWVSVGCSYAGALSAWFRLKHPDLTVAALSSSGVVHSIFDFYEFDQNVAAAISVECANRLREVTSQIESLLGEDEETNLMTKAEFDAAYMSDGDFYYMIADAAATTVQYGYQDTLCSEYLLAATNPSQYWITFANFTKEFWYPTFNDGSAVSYTTEYQRIEDPENASRAWWFQKCSELAYFQTAPAEGSLRSTNVNITWHLEHCEAVFGEKMIPQVYETNTYYGGANIAASKVYFANSSQDPWKAASVTTSPDPANEPAHLVVCHDCGHCSDLRGCPSLPGLNDVEGCTNMTAVNDTRAAITSDLQQWVFG